MMPFLRTIGLAGLAVVVGALAPHAPETQARPLDCKPWGKKPSLGTGCTLTRDDTVFGRQMPAGTQLHYDTLRVLDFFVYPKNALFEGLELAGTPTGPYQFLYPNGTPRRLWLARTQDVQGIPCRGMSFWTEIVGRTSAVSFHPSGHFSACRLGRAALIRGVALARGDRVELDDNDALVRGGR